MGPPNPTSTSLLPLPLPLVDENRSFHTTQEATDATIAQATRKRAPRVKRVVDQSSRVLRENPKKSAKFTSMAPAVEAPKRRAAGEVTGGLATKKARTNAEATIAGPPAGRARTKTATPSFEATKAAIAAKKSRKPFTLHLTTASSSTAVGAALPEASFSKSATTVPEASTSTSATTTDITTTDASTPPPSRRLSKRKATNMTGPASKKARVNVDATSAGTKAAAKAKASTKGKVVKGPAAKIAAAKASIGKGKKRAFEDDDEDTDPPPPPPPTKAHEIKSAKASKPKVVINQAPTERLDVFVCGEGSSGELGLGTAKNAIDVKRPRLNPFLSSREVGVVHVATGGMHAAALTHDNLIYTWGVNDQGALGRDTAWDGGLRDVDDSDDEAQDTNGLNPRECTPMAIPRESFPPGIVFVQLACGDSNTFALTDDGNVYGWGTFRVRFHTQYLSTTLLTI